MVDLQVATDAHVARTNILQHISKYFYDKASDHKLRGSGGPPVVVGTTTFGPLKLSWPPQTAQHRTHTNTHFMSPA